MPELTSGPADDLDLPGSPTDDHGWHSIFLHDLGDNIVEAADAIDPELPAELDTDETDPLPEPAEDGP